MSTASDVTLSFFGVLALAGCGAAPPPDLHAAFRRIQEHEAVIAHQAPDIQACTPDADCPAAARVCGAASQICAIAESIDDADARARCLRAQRRCPEGQS